MRAVLLLFLLVTIRCAQRSANAPAEPTHSSVPNTVVETWCRVREANPDRSYFVRYKLGLEQGTMVIIQMVGETESTLEGSATRATDAETIIYSVSSAQLLVNRQTIGDFEYEGVFRAEGTDTPVTCRSLLLD